MANTVTPFLMFDGSAEEAMQFYVALFAGSEIRQLDRYGPGEAGMEGTVKRADFTLAGQSVICIDSPMKQSFTFTPSISLYVECEDEGELDTVFAQLSEGGEVMMPPDNHGFSTRFCWVSDRFGVSWQLNVQ